MLKNILLGVSGSIAAYRAAELASTLIRDGYAMKVIMTQNATEFISPLTFQTLTNNKVFVDQFAHIKDYDVEHVSLSKWADLTIIAPATANIIAKISFGLADDALSSTMLAFPQNKPRLIAPAMNTAMYQNIATQNNLTTLKQYGYKIIEPREDNLACGDIGKGAMADIEKIVHSIAILSDN